MTDLATGPDEAPTLVGLRPVPRSAAAVLAGAPAAGWARRYRLSLVAADALSAVIAIGVGWALRFGVPSDGAVPTYLSFSLVVTAAWLVAVQLAGAYELRDVSTGTREAQLVLRAALNLTGGLAITAYLAHILIARTFVAIVIPCGAALMVLMRYVVRRCVYARRERGQWTSTILAVGTSESVRHLVEATRRNRYAGLMVVGACVEDAAVDSEIAPGVPVLGDTSHAARIAGDVDADVVAVAGTGLGPRRIKELGWELEGSGREMVMAPGLTEVAGPRVHVTPVAGLPLMWVDQPRFTGLKRLAKRAMDLVGALVLLALGLPFLLLIGLAVRLTSRGPALYRSVRVGADGRTFPAYKFRSMYVDADARRTELLARNDFAGGVLFKMRDDPRVTPVGRLLRKFSIDELPQLINVVTGAMSLVGPRPPLPHEVESYETHVHRRMLVKPGMTGLWQVSGRSDLSWEEAVRLDLYYVENWSLALDLAIIVRTVWAVVRPRGAY